MKHKISVFVSLLLCILMLSACQQGIPITITDGGEYDSGQYDYSAYYYSKATADLDRNGVTETYLLKDGPTSGIFTFTIEVYEQGQLKLSTVYACGLADLRFFEQSGALCIRAETDYSKTAFDPEELPLLKVVYDGETLNLKTEDGEDVDTWGEIFRYNSKVRSDPEDQ